MFGNDASWVLIYFFAPSRQLGITVEKGVDALEKLTWASASSRHTSTAAVDKRARRSGWSRNRSVSSSHRDVGSRCDLTHTHTHTPAIRRVGGERGAAGDRTKLKKLLGFFVLKL